MDRIRHFADLSIRRACGFAFLAIFTFMVGLAAEPILAIRAGAVLMAIMAAVLTLKGRHAPRRNYRDTEVWLLLEGRHGLPEHRAQQIFGSVLQERYMWYARLTGGLALFMWVVAIVLAALSAI